MPAIRTAVLIDERDRRLGTTTVPESVFLILHDGRIFLRTPSAIRLPGSGIGVVFQETEPTVRKTLAPL